MTTAILLLRLAGPLQSWGAPPDFNRRNTRSEPTKSGVVGLLAAAQGRHRSDPIRDLTDLTMGVRTDQPGSLLRDYHTVSDHRGRPLPSANLTAKGAQKPTSPAKHTHVTQRFYLQDAVFVAALQGPPDLLEALHDAITHPAYPLALGRRSCVPTNPIAIAFHREDSEQRTLESALAHHPWQAGQPAKDRYQRRHPTPDTIRLPSTIEDATAPDTATDVPISFDPPQRAMGTRHIRHTWLTVPTGLSAAPGHVPASTTDHDPFALLGW